MAKEGQTTTTIKLAFFADLFFRHFRNVKVRWAQVFRRYKTAQFNQKSQEGAEPPPALDVRDRPPPFLCTISPTPYFLPSSKRQVLQPRIRGYRASESEMAPPQDKREGGGEGLFVQRTPTRCPWSSWKTVQFLDKSNNFATLK